MKPIARYLAPACLAGSLLLTGCTSDSTEGGESSGGNTAAPGPTHTTIAAPGTKARGTAADHHRSGGDKQVYGIRRSAGPDEVPLLTVWTRNPDEDNAAFEELAESVTGYLKREAGLSLERGYLLDVFDRDGTLQHRLDARP